MVARGFFSSWFYFYSQNANSPCIAHVIQFIHYDHRTSKNSIPKKQSQKCLLKRKYLTSITFFGPAYRYIYIFITSPHIYHGNPLYTIASSPYGRNEFSTNQVTVKPTLWPSGHGPQFPCPNDSPPDRNWRNSRDGRVDGGFRNPHRVFYHCFFCVVFFNQKQEITTFGDDFFNWKKHMSW